MTEPIARHGIAGGELRRLGRVGPAPRGLGEHIGRARIGGARNVVVIQTRTDDGGVVGQRDGKAELILKRGIAGGELHRLGRGGPAARRLGEHIGRA